MNEIEQIKRLQKINEWIIVIILALTSINIGLAIRAYKLKKAKIAEDDTKIITCELCKQTKATIRFTAPDGTVYNVCQDCFIPMLQEIQNEGTNKGNN